MSRAEVLENVLVVLWIWFMCRATVITTRSFYNSSVENADNVIAYKNRLKFCVIAVAGFGVNIQIACGLSDNHPRWLNMVG